MIRQRTAAATVLAAVLAAALIPPALAGSLEHRLPGARLTIHTTRADGVCRARFHLAGRGRYKISPGYDLRVAPAKADGTAWRGTLPRRIAVERSWWGFGPPRARWTLSCPAFPADDPPAVRLDYAYCVTGRRCHFAEKTVRLPAP